MSTFAQNRPVATQQQAAALIVGYAQQADLDPAAVISVAEYEGGISPGSSAAVPKGHYDPDQQGHPGWSYGPFSTRTPGAVPGSVYSGPVSRQQPGPTGAVQDWAWSPEGISYAIRQIQAVAAGKTGPDAITSIVTGFEHPADPTKEIAAEEQTYRGLVAGGSGSPVAISNTPTPDLATPIGSLPIASGGGVNVTDAKGTTTTAPTGSQATGIFGFLEGFSLTRVLQLLLGGVLLVVGLFLLARQSSAAPL